jgi:multidrug efflux pump subunit AcrA (membrane-fusion protein)
MSRVFKPKAVERTNTMDVVRERKRGIPKAAYAIAGVAVLIALAVWALSSLTHQQSGTVVDKSTLVTDVATRGTLLRSVSAQGAFAPERVRVASATQSGVVNQVFVKPGTVVHPGDVIAQMENPALEAQEANAASALSVATANLADARQQAQASVIGQQSSLSDARAQSQADALQAQSYAQLHKSGLLATLQYRQAQIQAQKSADDLRNRVAQVNVAQADAQAKIAAAQAQVDQAQAALAAARAQVAALTVRAATSGIVQSADIDPGTSVAQNTEIARIADMHDLKVVLQVAESDVHAVSTGMQARIDTGNGTIVGRVARIAPAAQNGTVGVDVTFSRPLPEGARPDANVDGTIIISKIPDAVSIARPAGATDGSTIDLFKVVDGGTRAVRVRVRLGQGSNDRVQVLSGIAPGDTVIVSDMSAYPDQTVLRLR